LYLKGWIIVKDHGFLKMLETGILSHFYRSNCCLLLSQKCFRAISRKVDGSFLPKIATKQRIEMQGRNSKIVTFALADAVHAGLMVGFEQKWRVRSC